MHLQVHYNGTIRVMVQEVCGWAKVNVTSAINSWESRFGLWACNYATSLWDEGWEMDVPVRCAYRQKMPRSGINSGYGC